MECYAPSPECVYDVCDSKAHDCKYSKDSCSADMCMSCRQMKSLVSLSSLLLLGQSLNREPAKISSLRAELKAV